MPESQLKRLKASLRSAGVIRQQKPKKSAKQSTTKNDSRLDRNVALQSIREEFNPFELKTNRVKHLVIGRGTVKGAQGRPGLSKQIGEENRKRTLLVEMQRKNKVGGIIDRRFGENDPTMTPEEKMLERFTKEKQKRVRGGGVFNLDDDDDELTHFGQSLGGLTDDFDAGNDLMLSEEDTSRKRPLATEGSDDEEGPALKKSRAEVMKEVIAKSKLHKYERQKRKEDDEEEREKLDAQMGDIWGLLGAKQPSTSGPGTGTNSEPVPGWDGVGVEAQADGSINPERLARIEGKVYDYDAAVREMTFDKRSKPSERTKTEEEKVQEESERLRKLEEARLRRMRGEEDSESEKEAPGGDDDVQLGDAAEYGLGAGIPEMPVRAYDNPDGLVDGDYEASEDGYIDVDENGRVNSLEVESPGDSNSDYKGAVGSDEEGDDDGFLADVLPEGGAKPGGDGAVLHLSKSNSKDAKLAFTFPCPQTHEEMLEIVNEIPVEDIPTVVQRIRVLHHPKLHADNKSKLAQFSAVLLEHILYITDKHSPSPPFPAIETLIRHLHALSKSHPESVSTAFRTHLTALHEGCSTTDLTPANLILLTSVSTIFPTSDHFHQVTTPAMLVICKWLSQTFPTSLAQLAAGTYLTTLCMHWVRLSKRYIPEAINFVLHALSLLSSTKRLPTPGTFPYHEPESTLRMIGPNPPSYTPRKLTFADIFCETGAMEVKLTLVSTLMGLLNCMADAWAGKTAFTHIFEPALEVVMHLVSTYGVRVLPETLKAKIGQTVEKLTERLRDSRKTTAPLLLHYHRPLPIKTHAPKFEEAYSLDKHSRDADVKLKAEYKRERKGAIRELRKDSKFVAREKLKEDKKSSAEYHEKMRRLTAMVQTEEGAAANEYKRVKGRK